MDPQNPVVSCGPSTTHSGEAGIDSTRSQVDPQMGETVSTSCVVSSGGNCDEYEPGRQPAEVSC